MICRYREDGCELSGYLEETPRAEQLMIEEDVSSIYQMPEINKDDGDG